MTPVAIQIMQAIEIRLQGISVAAGYLTDLGFTLQLGWPQHLLASEQVSLPLAALHPCADEIDSAQRSNQKATRTIALELIANPHDTDPTYFDQALYDTRRALVDLERELPRLITITQGKAVWDQPEDSLILVRLTIPIICTYTDSY